MNENTKTLMVVLLFGIIILIVVNIISGLRISRLQTELQNINNNIFWAMNNTQNVNSSIWELSNRVDSISEQIIKSTRLSFDETAVIQSYNSATASANVKVSFYLREYNPGDTVSVIARSQEGHTHSVEANLSNDGRFLALMTLPVRENYVLSFSASGDAIVSGELTQFKLANQLRDRFFYSLHHGQSIGTNQPAVMTLHPTFTNNTQGNSAMEVTNLTLYIENESGEVISTWNLMPYLHTQGDTQVLELDWWYDTLSLSVGDDEGYIRPGEFLLTRLAVEDNMGIRYEQIESVFVERRQHDTRMGRGWADVVSAPVPVWAGHFDDRPWGMQIVE